MPELPETETIARDLDREVAGSAIVGVRVIRRDILRGIGAKGLERRVTGAMIMRCWRRAKAIIIDLDRGERIVVVPRFTGALRVMRGELPPDEQPYDTLQFALADGRTLYYRDVRRLGTVSLMKPSEFEAFDARLGPEPLDQSFTPEQLSGILRGSSQAVKKVLMDQRRIAGVGNIYANEALWRAGIDPSRPGRAIVRAEATRLHEALTGVLTEAIEARGTTFRDYRDVAGGRGGFAERLQAYGRGGQPCLRCGTTLVLTPAVDGRATVFCPSCQH